MASRFLELTADELRGRADVGEGAPALQEEGILSYLEVRRAPRQIAAIRAKLLGALGAGKGKATHAEKAYRLTIAFFPLSRS